MLVSAATLLLTAALAAPVASAQSSSTRGKPEETSGTVIHTVTSTIQPPAATGQSGVNTMSTGDENSRWKMVGEMNHDTLVYLAKHRIVAPNETMWWVCGTENTVQFDTAIPTNETSKNGTNLAFLLASPPSDSTQATLLDDQAKWPINPAYAGYTNTRFNASQITTCAPKDGYYLAAIDMDCMKDLTQDSYAQGCIWAVSDLFAFKDPGSMLSLPLPKVRGSSGASALAIPTAATLAAAAVAAAAVLAL